MTPTTLKALKLSIAHWDRLATGKRRKGETVGRTWCSLCSLFNPPRVSFCSDCVGCPVMDATKAHYCNNSPYVDALAHSLKLNSVAFKNAAKLELAFLKSLLPKKGKK